MWPRPNWGRAAGPTPAARSHLRAGERRSTRPHIRTSHEERALASTRTQTRSVSHPFPFSRPNDNGTNGSNGGYK